MKKPPTVIVCPTCAASNDEFTVVCTGCRGYLQNRLPNLDFFATVWGVIESPRETFRRIRLAEHKNYAVPLHAMTGIALAFTVFWYLKMGDAFSTLVDLVAWGTLTGIAGGIMLSLVLGGLTWGIGRAVGGSAGFRDSYATLAYAGVPVALSLAMVLPLELMTFGIYLFTSNPHPFAVQPVSYVILLGADGVVGGWSFLLASSGIGIAHGIRRWKAVVVLLVAVGLPAGAFFLAVRNLERAVLLPGFF